MPTGISHNQQVAEMASLLSRATLASREESKHVVVSWISNRNDSYFLRASPHVLEDAMRYSQGYFAFEGGGTPNRRLSTFKATEELEEIAMELLQNASAIPSSYLKLASIRVANAEYHFRFKNDSLLDITIISDDDVTIFVARYPEYLALARLLRNASASNWNCKGGIPFHAAAVEAEGKAVLLLGDKCAGKTTITCELMNSHSTEFISNDRVVVMPNGMVRGLPVSINIRQGTIRRYKQLSSLRGASIVNHHRISVNSEPSDLSLSASEFAGAFGVGISAEKPISSIFLVKRNETVDGVTLRHSTNYHLSDLIAQQRLNVFDYSQPYWPRKSYSLNKMMKEFPVAQLDVGNDKVAEAAKEILDFARTCG